MPNRRVSNGFQGVSKGFQAVPKAANKFRVVHHRLCALGWTNGTTGPMDVFKMPHFLANDERARKFNTRYFGQNPLNLVVY